MTRASSWINVTEVYAGLRPSEEAKTERLLRSLKFYPVTWEIAKQAGGILNAWRQRGRTLSLPDVTVADAGIANVPDALALRCVCACSL